MISKIFNWVKDKRDIIFMIGILILSLFLLHQYNRNSSLNNEVHRLENNILAVSDTLTIYKDKYDRVVGERHAYQLTQEELRDSVDLLKIKNREYITYINTTIGTKDTFEIPTYIDRIITNENNEQGIISFDKYDDYGKSNRSLSISIPYTYSDSLTTGNADVELTQNIYVESMIERDKRTGQTYVRLISDYPATFNSGMGVLVTNSNSYEKSIRKTKGIGIGIGPSLGVNYDFINGRIVPTVGFSITFGFTYTPKILQF